MTRTFSIRLTNAVPRADNRTRCRPAQSDPEGDLGSGRIAWPLGLTRPARRATRSQSSSISIARTSTSSAAAHDDPGWRLRSRSRSSHAGRFRRSTGCTLVCYGDDPDLNFGGGHQAGCSSTGRTAKDTHKGQRPACVLYENPENSRPCEARVFVRATVSRPLSFIGSLARARRRRVGCAHALAPTGRSRRRTLGSSLTQITAPAGCRYGTGSGSLRASRTTQA